MAGIYGEQIRSFNDIGDDPADNFKFKRFKGSMVRSIVLSDELEDRTKLQKYFMKRYNEMKKRRSIK